MLLKLAWRNLWRNKRRTGITMASVFFAVIMAINMKALKEGMYERTIDNLIGGYVGYVNVFGAGYWDEQVLDNSFENISRFSESLASHPEVVSWVPRLETVCLTSSEYFTKVGMVVGVDPERENEKTNLEDRVVEGEYFSSDSDRIMIGEGLAKALKVQVGDTVVLLGQGFHSVSAAGKYPVAGILKFGAPELNKRIIYLPLRVAQPLFGMEGRLTSLSMNLKDPGRAKAVAGELAHEFGEGMEVKSWNETMPELENMFEADRVEGYIFMAILYMIIAFGIFGTVLMMMAERQHEFGVMVAIGMKRSRLALVVMLETMMVSLAGALTGMVAALPIVLYFHANPIPLGEDIRQMTEDMGFEAVLQYSIDPSIFVQQGMIVALLAFLVALHPLMKLSRMNAIDAMRS